MTDTNETSVYLAAPIGHPLPIMQPITSTEDVEAWAHNYGSAWARTHGDPAPEISQWRIERFERLGEGHPSSLHVIGMASVDGDPNDDVLVVYDSLFCAQMWRMARDKADEMWPELHQYAVENAPKPEIREKPVEPAIRPERPWWKFWA